MSNWNRIRMTASATELARWLEKKLGVASRRTGWPGFWRRRRNEPPVRELYLPGRYADGIRRPSRVCVHPPHRKEPGEGRL